MDIKKAVMFILASIIIILVLELFTPISLIGIVIGDTGTAQLSTGHPLSQTWIDTNLDMGEKMIKTKDLKFGVADTANKYEFIRLRINDGADTAIGGLMYNDANPEFGNGDDFVVYTYADRDLVLKGNYIDIKPNGLLKVEGDTHFSGKNIGGVGSITGTGIITMGVMRANTFATTNDNVIISGSPTSPIIVSQGISRFDGISSGDITSEDIYAGAINAGSYIRLMNSGNSPVVCSSGMAGAMYFDTAIPGQTSKIPCICIYWNNNWKWAPFDNWDGACN